MYTIGILGSGVPKTFRHIVCATQTGEIPHTQVGIVICDRPNTPILEAAQELGVPGRYIARGKQFEPTARALLRAAQVDIVCLVGYLPKVGHTLLTAFPARILNGHSGPLPRFGGKGMIYSRTQAAVLAAGARYSGPTIHIVDAEYDHGQVLGHWPVRVRPDDTPATLDARCLVAGRQLYVQVLADFVYRLDHPELFA
jgi:phosphoribosylglycinamide formyltransferase 1